MNQDTNSSQGRLGTPSHPNGIEPDVSESQVAPRDGNRVALITGSGRRRLGAHIAQGLADSGYNIAVHYNRSRDDAETLVDELRQTGVQARAFPADLRSLGAIRELIAAVMQHFKRLDALINTASVWSPIRLEDITEDDLQTQFEVDLKGTFFCSQVAGLEMVKQPSGGAIVTFGDWALERPYPDHAAYFAVKGAIPTLTRTLARELATRNPKVRVNCVLPGPVMLPPSADAEERDLLVASTLVKQVDRPDSIVRAVKYFLEDDFITGVCLPVDGGRTVYAAGEDR